MAEFEFGGEIVWRPTAEYVEGSHLQRFMQQHGIADLARAVRALGGRRGLVHRCHAAATWTSSSTQPYSQVLDLSRGKPWAALVRRRPDEHRPQLPGQVDGDARSKHVVALRFEGEDGQVHDVDLRRPVSRRSTAWPTACALWAWAKGDAIGLFMPMTPEIAIALLAIAKIGGVILPLFSGYGAGAVATRLVDADAKALFTVDGAFRRGRPVADEDRRRRGAAPCARRPARHRLPAHRRGRALDRGPRPLGRGSGVARPVRERSGGDRTHRRRRRPHGDLHLGHHRPAQGRGAHPLRLPDQGGDGHGPGPRPAPARTPSTG